MRVDAELAANSCERPAAHLRRLVLGLRMEVVLAEVGGVEGFVPMRNLDKGWRLLCRYDGREGEDCFSRPQQDTTMMPNVGQPPGKVARAIGGAAFNSRRWLTEPDVVKDLRAAIP